MRVELPSMRPDGVTRNWLELREKPRPLDYSAVQEAGFRLVFTTQPDGTETRDPVGGPERQRMAMLARAITAWSFDGVPIPSQNIAKPEEVIDSTLDGDDYEVARAAVQPLVDRVLASPKPATGITTAS